MAIVKTKNPVETYRARSRSKDINELTGRSGRPDLTDFVVAQIVKELPLRKESVVVDVGCGDGLLLKKAAAVVDGHVGRLLGILPSKEEVIRVRAHLLDDRELLGKLISIEYGTAQGTSLPDGFVDVLVCNSVLHCGGTKPDDVRSALKEFFRITRPGATVFIGEIPDVEEMDGRNYGDSIARWLFWILMNRGVRQFFVQLRKTAVAAVTSEPFVVAPKKVFYSSPGEFKSLLDECGFEGMACFRHREIDTSGAVSDSRTRWNYIATKPRP